MSKDIIYREDAINLLWYFQDECCSAVVGDFEKLPSADRPKEWIPCSDRLPKIGEKVLVSTKKTVFTQVYKGIYSDPKRWAWENNSVKKIEAWQPLPKPWKGADDE